MATTPMSETPLLPSSSSYPSPRSQASSVPPPFLSRRRSSLLTFTFARKSRVAYLVILFGLVTIIILASLVNTVFRLSRDSPAIPAAALDGDGEDLVNPFQRFADGFPRIRAWSEKGFPEKMIDEPKKLFDWPRTKKMFVL